MDKSYCPPTGRCNTAQDRDKGIAYTPKKRVTIHTNHQVYTLIRWLGRLGRCVGANDHAIFCFPYGVCFGCVLGHLIVTLQLHLYSHDYIAVVMYLMIPSRLLSVSHVNIDPVGSHAPHQLVSELELSLPPPAPLCSKALPVALQGRD